MDDLGVPPWQNGHLQIMIRMPPKIAWGSHSNYVGLTDSKPSGELLPNEDSFGRKGDENGVYHKLPENAEKKTPGMGCPEPGWTRTCEQTSCSAWCVSSLNASQGNQQSHHPSYPHHSVDGKRKKLHQLIGGWPHFVHGFNHPRWPYQMVQDFATIHWQYLI